MPAMSGINERAAARIMKDVLGEASCKTDVLANIVPQLRNGNGAEALKDKNCEPAKIDGCNASVIVTRPASWLMLPVKLPPRRSSRCPTRAESACRPGSSRRPRRRQTLY